MSEGDGHECFELDGARVHGDPDMPPELRDALRAVIAAARAQVEAEALISDPNARTAEALRPPE